MRAELPWNVAGIPPEAREAARAAARRAGLSVGEWLTRRIIAELGEGAAIPFSTDDPGPDFVPAANRHQTEAMLARLAQAEVDASDTYHRIEAQLRAVGTGFDNAERSQSESHRAMSRAASEMTLASQEQADAFEQLGRHMTGVDGRLQKLERAALQDGMRDAVKGLHQGLSRLADQFGQTNARSGNQVTLLARNLEQLALRLVQTRADAQAATETLQSHLGQIEETHHFTNSALEQILARMDAHAEARDQDVLEARRRDAVQQSILAAIEDRLAVLEEPDDVMAQRLDAIEQELAAIREELDRPDPHAGLDKTLQQITARLDILELGHVDMVTELRDGLARIPEPAPEPAMEEISLPEPVGIAAAAEPIAAPNDMPSEMVFPPAEHAPLAALPDPIGNFVQDNFAHHFEMPQEFADALARSPHANEPLASAAPANESHANEQDMLDGARRAARDTVDSNAADNATVSKRPAHLAALAGLFFLLLAAAAALMLNQRAVRPLAPPKSLPRHVTNANPSALTWTPKLQTALSPVLPTPAIDEAKMDTLAPKAPAATMMNKVLAAADSGNDAAQTIIGLETLESGDATAAFQWLQKAALQGQPVAEYRLGTLYERGQGTRANSALAVKWYLAAATQGNRKAMHNLAVAYADGSGGKKDMIAAAYWFGQAAALGLSDSQFNLAVLYERGDGVPQSLHEAYKWYAIAAANGDAESRTRLSVIKTQLADSERTDADHDARIFQAQKFDRTANIPPQAGDIAS